MLPRPNIIISSHASTQVLSSTFVFSPLSTKIGISSILFAEFIIRKLALKWYYTTCEWLPLCSIKQVRNLCQVLIDKMTSLHSIPINKESRLSTPLACRLSVLVTVLEPTLWCWFGYTSATTCVYAVEWDVPKSLFVSYGAALPLCLSEMVKHLFVPATQCTIFRSQRRIFMFHPLTWNWAFVSWQVQSRLKGIHSE